MTIGDVLAVVGVIGGICLSLWAMLIGAALLFEGRAQTARRVWEKHTGAAFGVGFVLTLLLGVGGIALLNAPGALKIFGWIFLLALLALSLLGGSGLALFLGERTGARDENLSSLTALSRGAGVMALAWLFPVLGWFLVAPVCLIIGAGVGAKALPRKQKKQEIEVAPLLLPPTSQTAMTMQIADEKPCESHGATL
jgi:hypothetical protein